MNTYHAEIDNGQGGDEEIQADTIQKAMVEAIEWAMKGDWPDEGCDVDICITDDTGEELEETLTIEPASERELEDATTIAENVGEYTTKMIVVIDDQAYYRYANGGSLGSYDRMCGDGVWRESPIESTRAISKSEAQAKMLDWDYAPAEIARLTHNLVNQWNFA